MSTEHGLNAKIAKTIKSKFPDLEYIKTSDKYQAGLSDFFIFGVRFVTFLEVKYIEDLPARNTSMLLKHPFTREQMAFFRRMSRLGHPCYGAIGCGEGKKVFLVPYKHIPKEGNWELVDFISNTGVSRFTLDSTGLEEMVKHITIWR